MNEDKCSYTGWIIAIIIILFLWFLHSQDLGEKIEILNSRVEEYESQIEEYKSALEEANNNIEDAKSHAWESYEDMGYALESLETVSEP
jgi:chromosome segregation ATPase